MGKPANHLARNHHICIIFELGDDSSDEFTGVEALIYPITTQRGGVFSPLPSPDIS